MITVRWRWRTSVSGSVAQHVDEFFVDDLDDLLSPDRTGAGELGAAVLLLPLFRSDESTAKFDVSLEEPMWIHAAVASMSALHSWPCSRRVERGGEATGRIERVSSRSEVATSDGCHGVSGPGKHLGLLAGRGRGEVAFRLSRRQMHPDVTARHLQRRNPRHDLRGPTRHHSPCPDPQVLSEQRQCF